MPRRSDLECKKRPVSVQHKDSVTAASLHILVLYCLTSLSAPPPHLSNSPTLSQYLFCFLYAMFPYSWIVNVPLSSSLSTPFVCFPLCLCLCLSLSLFFSQSLSLSLSLYLSLSLPGIPKDEVIWPNHLGDIVCVSFSWPLLLPENWGCLKDWRGMGIDSSFSKPLRNFCVPWSFWPHVKGMECLGIPENNGLGHCNWVIVVYRKTKTKVKAEARA